MNVVLAHWAGSLAGRSPFINLTAISVLVFGFLLFNASAQIQPLVAVHDSELTRFLDSSNPASIRKPIQTILERGCLAGRMIRNWDRNRPWRDEAHYIYGVLCDNLAEGEQFGLVARQQWGL